MNNLNQLKETVDAIRTRANEIGRDEIADNFAAMTYYIPNERICLTCHHFVCCESIDNYTCIHGCRDHITTYEFYFGKKRTKLQTLFWLAPYVIAGCIAGYWLIPRFIKGILILLKDFEGVL